MKVAIYLRKSRGKEEDLIKHEQQLVELCNQKGWEYDIYKEIGSSQDNQRSEYVRMKQRIGEYKNIVVMALDRLSREKIEQAELTLLIDKYDFSIVTPQRTYTKEDSLTMDFEEMIARQEYRIIKQRQEAGRTMSHKNGKLVGGRPPLGYKYDRNTKEIVIDEERIEIFNLIKERALKGDNCKMIAERLTRLGYRGLNGKPFRNAQVRVILKCKTYIGMVSYKKEWIQGTHIPLMTVTEFNKIQEMMEKRSFKNRKRKSIYPLTDLIRCKKCNSLYGVKRRKDRKNQEYLTTCWKVNFETLEKCGNKGIKADVIHNEILSDLKERLEELREMVEELDKVTLIEKQNKLENDIEVIKDNIEKENNKIDRILIMTEEGIYTLAKAKSRIEEIENKIIQLNNDKNLLELEKENINSIKVEKSIEKFEKIINFIKNIDIEDEKYDTIINKMYKEIISHILLEVTENDVFIDIKYK
ncbi:MAG: recombinase family protein [Clostridium sp.]|uniref:recombinase family protein n=1 Tax=Clostridium sp. TaxID=1506 RepID=UPI003F3BFE35